MATVTGEALQHRAVSSLIWSAVITVIIAIAASLMINTNAWWWGFGGGMLAVGALAALIGWFSASDWYAEMAELG